jgi:methyltransferase, FkbM family
MFSKSSQLRYSLKHFIRRLGEALIGFSDSITYYAVTVIKREGNWVLCKNGDLFWKLDRTSGVDNSIIRTGFFEPQSIALVSHYVKPGMVAMDVGANFGYYAIQMSKLVGSNGTVHAFEPSSRFRERLIEHIRLNHCENIIVNNFGLSDGEKVLQLQESDDTATLRWWYESTPPIRQEDIQLKTLDSYVKEHKIDRVDFIKVDIDGHEPKFIAGASKVLKRFQPAILMEFMQLALKLNDSDVEILARTLKSLGYELRSEKTGKPFTNRINFLNETMNCAFSTNVLCLPHKGLHR